MIGPQFPQESPTRVTERTLREFSALCVVIFGGLFALNWYRHQHHPSTAGWIVGALAVLVGLPGLVWPNVVRPVFLGAMAMTKPIGHVVSLLLLGVVYYGLLTPLALVFRLSGRDGLGRHRRGEASYWVDRPLVTDVRRYLHQYQSQGARDPASPAVEGMESGRGSAPERPAALRPMAELPDALVPGAKHGSE